MKVEIFGSTDVGQVRDHNEDNFVVCKDVAANEWSYKREERFELGELGTVLFVADGMGGTNAGEVASEIAATSVQTEFEGLNGLPGKGSDSDIMKFLKDVIKNAHNNIVNQSLENPTYAGMGTTAVIAWVLRDAVFVAWSGDSRMYIYREGVEFYPNTDDHSMVWDLVKQGQLTAEEARVHEASNIITQSLGDDSRSPKPDARKFDLYENDRVMLCSDGLCGMLSDNMMGGLMSSRLNAADTCKELIAAANAAGGTDNITVLICDVHEGKPAPPPPKTASGAKTKAGAGAITASDSDNSGGASKKAMMLVGGLIVIALIFFFAFKDNIMGTPHKDPDVSDTTNVTTPLDTPQVNDTQQPIEPETEVAPTPTEVTGEEEGETGGSKDNKEDASPTESNPNKPAGNNTGTVTPKPVEENPDATTPPESEVTPPVKDTTPKPGTNIPKPTLPVNPPGDNGSGGAPGNLTPREPGNTPPVDTGGNKNKLTPKP